MTPADATPADEAWQRACSRLAALGDQIAGDDFPGDPADRVAGVAHLAEQALSLITQRGSNRGRDLKAMFTRLRAELKA